MVTNREHQNPKQGETDFANISIGPKIDPESVITFNLTNMTKMWRIDSIQGTGPWYMG